MNPSTSRTKGKEIEKVASWWEQILTIDNASNWSAWWTKWLITRIQKGQSNSNWTNKKCIAMKISQILHLIPLCVHS